jgi:hypothetical protein
VWGCGSIAPPFLTSALDGRECPDSRLGRFSPRDTAPVPITYEAVWTPEPVWILWRTEEFLAPSGNQIPTYIYWAITALPILDRWNWPLIVFSQDGGKRGWRCEGKGGGWYGPARAGVPGQIVAGVTWPPRGVCQDPPPTPRKPKKRRAVGANSHVRGRFLLLKQQTVFLCFRD